MLVLKLVSVQNNPVAVGALFSTILTVIVSRYFVVRNLSVALVICEFLTCAVTS